jgi:peptidoglycan hydrolase CwlO-like protein
MKFNERFLYSLKIVILLVIIAWLLFSNEEDYTEDYNAKIVALEQKVDSLHYINDELTFKIDTLNNQVSKLDQQIDLKDNRIKNLKWKVNEKVNAVDSFDDNELERFFTERYGQYIDSIKKTNSKTSN